jgi:hypothetical protein
MAVKAGASKPLFGEHLAPNGWEVAYAILETGEVFVWVQSFGEGQGLDMFIAGIAAAAGSFVIGVFAIIILSFNDSLTILLQRARARQGLGEEQPEE